MKIEQFIWFLLCGLMFLNAGLDKLIHYMPMPKMEGEMAKLFDAFSTIKWLMPFVGFFEILGGLLIIIPKTRVLGGLILLPIMLGIVVHNAVFMPSGLAIAIPLFLINIWAVFSKRKYWQFYSGENGDCFVILPRNDEDVNHAVIAS